MFFSPFFPFPFISKDNSGDIGTASHGKMLGSIDWRVRGAHHSFQGRDW